MPFIQALGYDVFNPAEVIPEFTADVGIKKGEKVDYAIRVGAKINILIECKPSSAALSAAHASQLFRYFSVTDARIAILTNGVVYQFYSDVEKPNKMDDKPFFIFSLEALKATDVRTVETFTKAAFDIDKIVHEAESLKTQSILKQELEKELASPSEEFVRLLASRVYEGRLTPSVKDNFAKLIANAVNTLIREQVTSRLSSAINATDPAVDESSEEEPAEIVTTPEEVSGFHIVQAIASRHVQPRRVVIRDAKAYCAILLDDNNRKTLVRLHFNGITKKYLGTFVGKTETRHLINDLTEIYQFESQISARIKELESSGAIELDADGGMPDA